MKLWIKGKFTLWGTRSTPVTLKMQRRHRVVQLVADHSLSMREALRKEEVR